MARESKVITGHEEIRRWVEARGGKPATVKRTGAEDEPGILRVDFPGVGAGESLEEISWEQFFAKFDANHLAFLYQEETFGSETSRFHKFVHRETAKARKAA